MFLIFQKIWLSLLIINLTINCCSDDIKQSITKGITWTAKDPMCCLIMPRVCLGYTLILPSLWFDYALKNTLPPASRRDHRNGERPCGARLWGQDGQCHKEPTRGIPRQYVKQCGPIYYYQVVLSLDNDFLHFRLFPNPQISFWQSRELKPDLISPPHTLTSMIPGFQFYI